MMPRVPFRMKPVGVNPGRAAKRLLADRSGVALIEFAYSLPLLLGLSISGAEITNYITMRLRISQLALHVADHGARLGEGSQLQAKTISESDINDLFTGANLQAREMGLFPRGRVIISSLEPVASPNPTDRYMIRWQRCRGVRTHASSYGVQGQTNMVGMGPAARQIKSPPDGAAIFVEISYLYRSIVPFWPQRFTTITEIASMPVRDRRDPTVQNNPPVPMRTCNLFSA